MHYFVQGLTNLLARDPDLAFVEISNYHPAFSGTLSKDFEDHPFTEADIRETIAREYGFESWEKAEIQFSRSINPTFEEALKYLLSGNKEKLSTILATHPQLVETHSSYCHEATLLHYAGSNGVELWRQIVPLNLPEMVKLLLDRGADPQAKMKVYGGQFTFWELYSTSAHPYDADIDEKSIKALLGDR